MSDFFNNTMDNPIKLKMIKNNATHHLSGKEGRQTDVSEVVMKGAAGVAVAAGLVAAGAALSNKDTRQKITKVASKGIDILQEKVPEIEQKTKQYYPSVKKFLENRSKSKH